MKLEQRIRQAAEEQHEGAAFILGAEWMLSEVQPLIEALEAGIEEIDRYLNWNADELSGDDLVGDGRRSKRYQQIIIKSQSLREALAKFRGEG